jgi:hypothetical protein
MRRDTKKESSMSLRWMPFVLGALAFAGTALTPASGQNSPPFTIRFPPDGATVREKVPIRVPLASIPAGGYVAYAVDGEFRVALTPTSEQRDKAKAGEMFEYIWDTKVLVKSPRKPKTTLPDDGQHTLSATLFIPKPGNAGGSSMVETSSVTVTLANAIPAGNDGIALRYRFEDGSNRTYERTGTTSILAGLSQGTTGTGDIEVASQNSELLLAVEDVYRSTGRAIVRNRMTKLAVRNNGQETTYPKETLPKSIYQEVDGQGVVLYPKENKTNDPFWTLGVPVSANLVLPILPAQQVRVGDKWTTPNVEIDVPGMAPDKRPKVSVESTFIRLEWQSGRETAVIKQTYKGTLPKDSPVVIGSMQIDTPEIKFDCDIYVAYKTGTLIKTVRNLEISGKTSQAVSSTGFMSGGEMGGAMGGAAGMPGAMGGAAGMPGGMGGAAGMPSSMMGGMSAPPMPSMGGSGAPMMPGGGGLASGAPGMPGMGGGRGRTRMGGMPGSGGMPGMGRRGMGGMPGMPGMGGSGAPGGLYGMTGGSMGMGSAETSKQVTLKSVTVTELQIAK